VVADPAHAAPAVVTIELPPHTSAFVVGKAMDASGFLLSYRSAYLREQNWLQVCLMGAYEPAALRDLVATLIRAVTNPASFHAPCAP
jgi:hypothetical protein